MSPVSVARGCPSQHINSFKCLPFPQTLSFFSGISSIRLGVCVCVCVCVCEECVCVCVCVCVLVAQ